MQTVLQLSHLSFSYGKKQIINDLSFELQAGEIVSFLGINGAGKSTCMQLITGALNPSVGQIRIGREALANTSLSARRKMGYLPEDNPLYDEMYVKEYLCYIAEIYQLPQASEEVDRWLEQLHLTDVYRQPIHTLSKGYQQRIGLAQALLHDPEVVLLDEPFTGLDPNQLEEMMRFIQQIGQDKAILFSTHILSEVTQLCSRLLLLHQGQLVANQKIESTTTTEQLHELFKAKTR
jgi:ABC-2 type transport system ATP-binding protein